MSLSTAQDMTWRWALGGVMCVLASAVLSAVAWQQRPAAAQAELLGVESTSLTEVYAELEPGEFAGTLLLGGMRGLVADLFWLRAIEAKDQGRYYESVALFQLLSRLQPQFEQVWEFLSHDLAYNIPRSMPTQDEKYAWFVAGIEANARGCVRNPRSSRLMRHLAWMFFHRGAKFASFVQEDRFQHHLDGLLQRHGLTPFFERTLDRIPAVGDRIVLPDQAEQLHVRDGRYRCSVKVQASISQAEARCLRVISYFMRIYY